MKGIAIVWIEILLGLFIIGLVYVLFSHILYDQVSSFAMPMITNSTANTTEVQNSILYLNYIWQYLPFIGIIVLFIYGIYMAQKRESGEYG